jgi:hypothetical protein
MKHVGAHVVENAADGLRREHVTLAIDVRDAGVGIDAEPSHGHTVMLVALAA